ncbi:MAG: arginine--tRNA ligase [Pseudomonadales bacterium]|jgi:arginyl-tRNA synthetase|nr:arginine--tRNA ligase [Pseudomonadales bacterium]MDP7356911.1 arginine--tRNA ligase [Pseudomonadales bacterium]MDP7595991.1 arginine--tRNA ligase [Pseudomonadales bacterium]HJN52767.1 arginine--tRNA ligase [Pseudomonadales bacterium]|tara:strand:+ start:872 stop:2602 length:1731 start_codon:yes stop_codon:yes gene_type:complete
MNIRDFLAEKISRAMSECGAPTGTPAVVKQSGRPEHGQYQANGVMAAAKKMNTNPREFAEQVVSNLQLDDVAERVEIAGPGFINIHVDPAFLSAQLMQFVGDSRLGVDPVPAKTIVVDYSAPNLAKEMHIGHLRGTTIGDSLVRLLEFLGHKVVRANHMGDWGSQFGRLLAYMNRLSNDTESLIAELSDLETFYQAATKLYDEDPQFADLSREFVVKLQSGDPECGKLWQRFIDESIHHCQKIYTDLNITLTPADIKGESFYSDQLAGIVEELAEKDLVTLSEGAKCVFLDEFKGKEDKPLPAIVQNSSGAYPYISTDLAAVKYRTQTIKADRALYFIDARQSLHLRQLFAISRAAGYLTERHDFRHLPFGVIMGDDGKPFQTRSGGVVKLATVLAEAKTRALQLVTAKSPDLAKGERQRIAEVVGIGAVKYAELSKNRSSDYIFNWDAMLSFDGNTAPYLQYAFTRIRSIFRREGIDASTIAGSILIDEIAEQKLAIKLLQFTECIDAVVQECLPNLLCNYLYELAGLFMSFYEACPVLKADEPVKSSRLLLCSISAETLRKGLELLGIETVEKM